MRERISKKMIVATKPLAWISIIKRTCALIAIKMHACDAKIWSDLPAIHLAHSILDMLRRGWLEIGKADFTSLYIKMQGALHCSIHLMAGMMKQRQVNFKTTARATPLADVTTHKADATSLCSSTANAITIYKWLRHIAPPTGETP